MWDHLRHWHAANGTDVKMTFKWQLATGKPWQIQPDSHLHLVCRHEVTFRNTLMSKEGKCWMVFLMGLSVAKRPTGDLIYRGRTWQNELMREVCVHVHVCLLHGKAASGKCIQFCFYRKNHHIVFGVIRKVCRFVFFLLFWPPPGWTIAAEQSGRWLVMEVHLLWHFPHLLALEIRTPLRPQH